MDIKIIIPTRLDSKRFPNKPLAKIQHKEMILHVCDRASKVYPVIVATPDIEIKELVEKHGYEAMLTSKDCLTGTDRVAEVAKYVNADVYVNVQGDEPLILEKDIKTVVNKKVACYNHVINGMALLEENNSNVVKVHEKDGHLVSMTREGSAKYKQCGIYAFNKEELLSFGKMPRVYKQKHLDKHENIEIMRFVDMGIPVEMVVVNGSPAVDVPGDILKIMEVILHE